MSQTKDQLNCYRLQAFFDMRITEISYSQIEVLSELLGMHLEVMQAILQLNWTIKGRGARAIVRPTFPLSIVLFAPKADAELKIRLQKSIDMMNSYIGGKNENKTTIQ